MMPHLITRPVHSARAPHRARHAVVAFALILTAACSADSTLSPLPDEIDPARRPPPTTSASFLAGASLWINPASNAKVTADAWRATRPADAAQLDKIAAHSQATWIGDWNTNVQLDVDAATSAAAAAGAVPVFVAYNIPHRDCGGWSGGNSTTPDAYRTWIAGFAKGIGARRAVVILEPDGLALMDCLSAIDQKARFDLFNYAVTTLRATGTVAVYLDAGHPRWKSTATMASRLTSAGIAAAQGFSLNVSNFLFTNDNVAYGTQLSALVGNKHFIVDTGRNGLGPAADAQWCNPDGRALGTRPTTQSGNVLVDAYLWIKAPGESDGACNRAPAAGAWMPDYALGLAQRAAY